VWLKTDRQADFDLASNGSRAWSLIGRVEDDTHLEVRFFFQPHPRKIVQAFTD
jgi:hypothetical protein